MKACNKKTGCGHVHSIETFGTHEGPGIRFVLFLQGCRARCLYCQNPDTWKEDSGTRMTADEVFEKAERCLPYIFASRGGVTVSGGEPLLQMDFVSQLFSLCKAGGVHTAVDTAAFYLAGDRPKIAELMRLTDLFIVDIKAAEEALHRRMTGQALSQAAGFLDMLERNNKEYWVRYVLVPGLNDSERDLKGLAGLVGRLKQCQRVEFLPYHTLGKHKWEHLGLSYPLGKTRPATDQDIQRAEALLRNSLTEDRLCYNIATDGESGA